MIDYTLGHRQLAALGWPTTTIHTEVMQATHPNGHAAITHYRGIFTLFMRAGEVWSRVGKGTLAELVNLAQQTRRPAQGA